jgi:hypothetical protein
MKKVLFLLVCFVCMCTVGFGQSKIRSFFDNRQSKRESRWASEHVYKLSALSLTSQTLQQQVFSQNQFSGLGISSFYDRLIDRPTVQKGLEQTFAGTMFLKSPNSESKTNSADVNIGVYYLRKLKNPSFALGGQLNFILGARLNSNYDNNSVSGEAIIELAPKMRYIKDVYFLRKSLRVDYSLSASLAGVALWTPTFTSNFTLIGKGLVAPNKYNHINSRLFINLPAGKRFTNLRATVGYGWNMYILKANTDQNIINATHTIYLIAKLNKLK